ncbi:hypothetical protein K3727_10100 [Rhodobacteraceae bacterium M382]|nr:hypothetical protein K3727_10100 [Rhodobacteraceae bacterium M382]
MLTGAGIALLALGVLGLLIAVAAVAESILRRNRHRSLSRHAVTKRRWDDPALDQTRAALLKAKKTRHNTGSQTERGSSD